MKDCLKGFKQALKSDFPENEMIIIANLVVVSRIIARSESLLGLLRRG